MSLDETLITASALFCHSEAISFSDFVQFLKHDPFSESVRFDEKEGVSIYIVKEYTFDTDLFDEGDEDYSLNSPAIIDTNPVYAMCHPCSDEAFAQVQEAWKESYPGLELVRYEDDDDEEE